MVMGLVKIMGDPEVLKNPVAEGQRVGSLFSKHTTLLDVKYAQAMLSNQPTTVVRFRKECRSMMKDTFEDFATPEPGEDSEDDLKRHLFWKTVLENYKA